MGKWFWMREKTGLWLASVRGCRDARPEGTVVLYYLRTGRLQDRLAGAMVAGSRLTVAAPEPFQDIRRLPRSLVGPPVATAVEQNELAAHARREALREARRD